MQDRPTAIELLEAAAQFIDRDIVPVTEGSRQFQARVAANVMRIVARELKLEEPQLQAELQMLAQLLERPVPSVTSLDQLRKEVFRFNEELTERIRGGDADQGPWRQQALGVVRTLVDNKLKIANPRYLEAELKLRA